MRYIDLRSDTVTEPTEEMRRAMATCPVGDDVFEDDPTTLRLESLTASMMGKEAALFVPSGTFSNQLALFTHCERGDGVIVDADCHIVIHESGASAIIAGVQLCTLPSDNGIWDLAKLTASLHEKSMFTPGTRLICMENAYGGRVLPVKYMKKVFDLAHSRNIAVHLDGARIFNAATALKCDVAEIAACADTHLKVAKTARKGRTFVEVESLAGADERARELALMMAGQAAGDASLEAARELLRHAGKV